MSVLFTEYDDTAVKDAAPPPDAPLAARMRPRALDEFIGQDELEIKNEYPFYSSRIGPRVKGIAS